MRKALHRAMKNADKMTQNKQLLMARLERGWTQEEVAAKIETTAVSISRWEGGTAFPSPYFRDKLCKLYGKNEEELGLVRRNTAVNDGQKKQEQLSQGLWNVPYSRNPFFTGRDDVLLALHNTLLKHKTTILKQAISGLGGIGKTQTAVEYAYRYRDAYQAVFWIRGDSYETLTTDFVEIAHLLELSEQTEQDQNYIVAAVRRWLDNHGGWLLIFDNVEGFSPTYNFYPQAGHGHILLTTRDQAIGEIEHRVEIGPMKMREGIHFLLRRAKLLAKDASLASVPATDFSNAKAISKALGHIPLALEQAGAYIEETQCTLSTYLDDYNAGSAFLLRRHGRSSIYPKSVADTWSLSFEAIEKASSAAANMLRLCAFLHSDGIPEEIILEALCDFDQSSPDTAEPYTLNHLIGEALRYSLIQHNSNDKLLYIHRLVQAVLRDNMDKKTQRTWSECAVGAVDRTFPPVEIDALQRCQRYLPHALACAALIKQWDVASLEAAHLLQQVGNYLWARFQYEQSEPLCQEAITIYEKILGPEHPDTASALSNLGSLYLNWGKYDQAEPLYLRAQTICEKVLGSEHPDVATNLANLAYLYEQQGKFTEAEVQARRALAIREKILGSEHPDVASSLGILAGICLSQGKYDAVEPLYQRTLNICEKKLGLESPDMANSLNNLAVLYMTQGKYTEAEPLCLRALSISEKVWGPEHPNVAFCLSNLAMVYFNQGNYNVAEPLCQRAPAIRETELGSEHRYVANSLSTLAAVYKSQQKYDQAEQLYRRAQGIYEMVLGLEHPDVATNLVNLSTVCTNQGKYNQAELFCQQALAIRMKILEPEHPDMAHSFSNLAMIYTKQEKYTDAEPLYGQALAITEKTLGPNHPDTAKILEDYADLLKKMAPANEAAELEARAHRIRDEGA